MNSLRGALSGNLKFMNFKIELKFKSNIFLILALLMNLTSCGPRENYSVPLVIKSASKKACIPRPDLGKIHFDCSLSDEHYETLLSDLNFLKAMEFRGPSAIKLQQLLGLNTLSGASLFSWLEERVQTLLDPSFEFQKNTHYAFNKSISLLSVYNNPFANLEVPGFGSIEINSQRIGVVLLGNIFFDTPTLLEGVDIKNSYTIQRLSTLIHEARHSDGRENSFGFFHIECPKGHPEAGEPNCDPCNNGAYRVQMHFVQSAIESCDECNFFDKTILGFHSNSHFNRVLPNANECNADIQF